MGWVRGEQDFKDWAAGWAVPSLWGRVLRMPGWDLSWALEKAGQKVQDSTTVHWGPETAPSLRRFPGRPPAVRGVPGLGVGLGELCAQGRGLPVKEASVRSWPWPACMALYITRAPQLDEWGSVWAGGWEPKATSGGPGGGGPRGQRGGSLK